MRNHETLASRNWQVLRWNWQTGEGLEWENVCVKDSVARGSGASLTTQCFLFIDRQRLLIAWRPPEIFPRYTYNVMKLVSNKCGKVVQEWRIRLLTIVIIKHTHTHKWG